MRRFDQLSRPSSPAGYPYVSDIPSREVLLQPFEVTSANIASMAMAPGINGFEVAILGAAYQDALSPAPSYEYGVPFTDAEKAILRTNLEATQKALVGLGVYKTALWLSVTIDAWRRNRTFFRTLAWSIFGFFLPVPAVATSIVVDVFPAGNKP